MKTLLKIFFWIILSGHLLLLCCDRRPRSQSAWFSSKFDYLNRACDLFAMVDSAGKVEAAAL
jgi:hypothetical protein